jgi:hypothetical protein
MINSTNGVTMNEHDLDLLLADARKDATAPSAALARLVATESIAQGTQKVTPTHRWLRRGFLVPVGIGAIALSAATTYGAYQLSIPPFVESEPGVERVAEPISVDYTTDKGTVLACNLYLEFTDVTQAQRDALNGLSESPKWDGFGQRTYDALPAANRATQNGPEALWADRVSEAVYEEAVASIPGLKLRAAAGTPSIHGSTTRCEYPEGQR